MQGPCAAALAAAACQPHLHPAASVRCSWQRMGLASASRWSVNPRLVRAPCRTNARIPGGTLQNAGSCSSTSGSSCSTSTRSSRAACSAGLCSTSSRASSSSWTGHRQLGQPCPRTPPTGGCSSSNGSSRSSPQLGRVCAAAIAMPWQQAWNPGLNLRCFMAGVLFTLGAQLLLALLLRVRAVRQALGSFNRWLYLTFGFSFRSLSHYETSGSSSSSSAVYVEEGLPEPVALARSSSAATTSSSSSSSSSRSAYNPADGRKLSRKERTRQREQDIAHHMLANQPGETVEWVNMCLRKSWRVYQRGLEQWITDLLQPVFDGLVEAGSVPRFVQRLRIVELTLDHEAPYVSNMRRRNSRKDSDLTGVVDLRYTGGARMLLMLEVGSGRWRFKVPVLVSDLDLECKMWLKVRLAPMCPWIGTISLAFVGPPNVKVQLSPYNRVRLMRIPVLQNFLTQLLTVDLPGLMVLPERLEINIPPSVTSVAEAAVGRDTIMRAVASAVLQVDSLEQALLAALPLGPQTAAGGVSLPEFFRGELTVLLREGRNLPVWGLPWQSNPWCRLVLGEQAVSSRRDNDTGQPGRHRSPVWNQEVQFLVEDPDKQVLELYVNDSHLTGRPKVGRALLPLTDLPADGSASMWLPLEPVNAGQKAAGEVLMDISYKPFVDDEQDSGHREAQAFAEAMQQQQEAITDIRSAAAASSRAAVAASAAISAIAMTKAAAARAAARAAQAAKEAGAAALSTVDNITMNRQAASVKQAAAEADLTAALQRQEALKDALVEAVNKQRQAASDNTTGSSASSSPSSSGTLPPPPAALPAPGTTTASSSSSSSSNGVVSRPPGGAGASTTATPSSTAAAAVGTRSGDVAGEEPSVLETWPAEEEEAEGEEEEVEEVTQRVQRATQEIRQRTQKMEAAVAELAQLAAGSPAQAVLQEGAARAQLAAEQAIAALSSRTASPGLLPRPPASSSNGSSDSSSSNGAWNGTHRSTRSYDGSSEAALQAAEQLSTEAIEAAVASEAMLSASSSGRAVLEAAASRSGAGSSGGVAMLEAPSSRQQVGGVEASWTAGSAAPPASLEHAGSSSSSEILGTIAGGSSRAGAGWKGADGPSGGSGSSNGVSGSSSSSSSHSVSSSNGVIAPEAAAIGVLDTAQQLQEQQQRRAGAKRQQEGAARGGGSGLPLLPPTEQQPGATGDVGEASAAQPQDNPWWSALLQPWGRPPPSGDAARSQEASGKGGATNSSSSSSSVASMDTSHASGDPDPQQALINSEPLTTSQRAWWEPLINSDFVKSLPILGGDKGAKASQDAAATTPTQQQQQQPPAQPGAESGDETPWWDVGALWGRLTGGGRSEDEEGGEGGSSGEGGSKPVEAIIIPPDLPLEEIAKEVAKLKEESWRSKEGHVESLWARAVERNDRSWVMLLCFLITIAVGLLAVVAYRLGLITSTPLGDGSGSGLPPGGEALVEQVPLLLMGLLAAYLSAGGSP